MNLSSIVFDLSHRADISDWDNTVLNSLVCSNIDSKKELRRTVEKIMNNPPILNLERPVVIRQYFGKENDSIKNRNTHGTSSSSRAIPVDTKTGDKNSYISVPKVYFIAYITSYMMS